MTGTSVPVIPVSSPPDALTWQALHRATEALRQLAPWQWLKETHLFAVRHPETATMGYISVTGALEESPGLMVYLGPEGWEAYWRVVEFLATAATVPEELAWETRGLWLTWVEQEALTAVDRQVGEFLGVDPALPLWPVWRSLRPGYIPWYLTAAEARFLRLAVEQTLIVAADLADNPDLLLERLAQGQLLVRVPRERDNTVVWESAWHPLPEEVGNLYHARISQALLAQLSSLPLQPVTVEVDVFALPVAVREGTHTPPAVPHVLLVVEEKGEVLQAEMLTPRGHLRHVYESVPERVAQALVAWKGRPSRVLVRRSLIHSLLQPLADAARCPVVEQVTLPTLDAVRWQLVRHLQQAGADT